MTLSADIYGSHCYAALRAPVEPYPVTLAIWHRPETHPDWATVIGMSNEDGSNRIEIETLAGKVASYTVIGATYEETGTFTIDLGAWHHLALVGRRDNLREIWVNGILRDVLTTSLSGFGLTRMYCGGTWYASSWLSIIDGQIAHPAIWQAALSPDQLGRLARGASPKSIARPALRFYARLQGLALERDEIGGRHLSATNATPSIRPFGFAPHVRLPYEDPLATGATVFLFSALDEVSADDADYIWTATPNASVTLSLSDVIDPASSAGHIVRYRARRGSSNCSIKAELLQSSTVIAEWTDSLSEAFATFSHTLTSGEADSLSPTTGYYRNLRLRLTAL